MSACPQCGCFVFTDETICAKCWRGPNIVDELLKKKSPSVPPPPKPSKKKQTPESGELF